MLRGDTDLVAVMVAVRRAQLDEVVEALIQSVATNIYIDIVKDTH